MSMLGPYASYSERTGWHPHPLHTNIDYTGIFERIDVGIKGIIHVGMWDFVEHVCYTKLVGNKVIGVEGNPQVFNEMSRPVAEEAGYEVFNECLTDTDGEEKKFFLAAHGSSFHQGPPEWGKNSCITVETKTLSTLMEEKNLDPSEYDFLNIDVEGSELEVLKGYEKYLKYVNVIDLETTFQDRHAGGCTHNEIVEWLSDRGFELKESSDSYQKEGWGDSVFVRVDKELPKYHDCHD